MTELKFLRDRKESKMGFRMTLTYTRKPSERIIKLLNELHNDKPADKRGWKTYFDDWSIPELMKDMEDGVKGAEQILDAQAKGFKPVAEGKETHYGVRMHYPEVEYWYQRQYTK